MRLYVSELWIQELLSRIDWRNLCNITELRRYKLEVDEHRTLNTDHVSRQPGWDVTQNLVVVGEVPRWM